MLHASSIDTATFDGKRKLFFLIRDGAISFGENKKLKIYGTMNCGSGKRMLEKNQEGSHSTWFSPVCTLSV